MPVAAITEDAIRELAAFRGREAPVTTCYLDVDGRRFIRHLDYQHELELLLKSGREQANGSASVADDFRRIEDYVKRGFDRASTRGLAFFSCSAHDLWEVVSVPVPVRSSIVVNSAPAVGQLELLVQDYEPMGVLLADRQRARLFVFDMGELVERSELIDELPRDYDERGHSDQGHARERHHVEELAHQHLRHAAEVAFRLYQEHGFSHFAIGAPDAIAHELEGCLHPYLRERLCGRIGVPVGSPIEDIRAAAIDLEIEVDRQREATLVARLRDAIGAGQRAVAGLDEVLRALHERRVEHLVVSAGFAEAGWRCGTCDALACVGPSCPACSSAMHRIVDVVEDAVEDSLSQGIRVSICVDNADLDVAGRVGAFLRY
jgi:peptide chain release factor subunit 1